MKTIIAYTPVFIFLMYSALLPTAAAQNLVPNPSFETYTQCPIGYGAGGPLDAPPWQSATDGTVDYFNVCANPSVVGIPDNAFGSQAARTGEAYAGGFFSLNMVEYREYLMVQLNQPLLPGGVYSVSYYINLGGLGCAIQTVGVLFTIAPPASNGSGTLDYTPQIETNMGYLNDTTNWVLIEDCFIAQGGEEYMTIGNFQNYLETTIDPSCPNSTETAYYYIDDVSVVQVPPGDIVFDLGNPVQACDSFEIDPGITGVNYFWPNGSTDPTLTVSTSGTYSLTVYNGCESGVDDLIVTLNNPDPVEISPDQVTICSGDAYTISLDPDDGAYEWNDGSTDPVYSITIGGLYQVTLDDGCDLTTADINITVMDEPESFNLGPDTVLCAGEEIEYYFDPALGDFEWQDNSTNNAYVIVNDGTYSLMISNMCGVEIDEIEVTTVPAPWVNLGTNMQIVCNGDPVDMEFDLDPNIGEYLWQDGSNSPSYQITAPGSYSVTVSNLCGSAIDTLNIVQADVPVIDFDDSLSLCPGDTVVLDVHGLPGNYIWQDNSTGTEYAVTSTGLYALTVSNICGTGSDSIVVNNFIPPQAPDLGPDFNLCPGDEAVLDAGNPGVMYTWQDQSTADTFLVNSAGTYHVQVSNGCQSVADTIVVMMDDMPPSIVMADQFSLCQGSSQVLDPGLNGVVYTWSDGSHDPTLVVTSAGTYNLTVTNVCGSDIDTVTVLDGGPGPVVSLGPDISVCTGEMININPFSSNVTSWLWPDGSINTGYSTTSAGIVYVEASNGCGVAYDTMTVNLLPLTPTLSLGPDVAICPGTTSTLTITEPNVDIVWSNGTTGTDFTVSDTATQVYATMTNGCDASADTINVLVLPAVPLLDLGTDQSLCPGEVITIDPGISGVNYEWQDGSTGQTYQTTQQATVILTISNVCGTSADTVIVTESTDGPQVDLGPDIHACEGVTISIPANISGVTYLWQDGSNANAYLATGSGWIHLTVSNLCGTDTDSVWVDISGNAPAPDLGSDTTLCEGTTLTLVADADALTSIEWQDGSSAQTYLVTSPGTYSLTEANQCGTSSDNITVSFTPMPLSFSLGPDTMICPGEAIVLHAPQTSDALVWQDGSDQPSYLANMGQTYSLQIINACGVSYDSLVVDLNPDVPLINLIARKRWCPGDQIVLDASQPFDATYVWSTGENSPSIMVSKPGIYSVDVIGPCNTSFGQVEVIAMNDCVGDDIYIPNVFSPNGDQINDRFALSFGSDVQITSISGTIYDRWGNLVFTSTAIPFEWDGKFGGEEVVPGVYVYQVQVSYMLGVESMEEIFTGDVTVLR
jgi:gliding motility-associated-like protein